MNDVLDCDEDYEACKLSRRSRVQAALLDPALINDGERASAANVSVSTIERARRLLQKPSGDGYCNKIAEDDIKELPPVEQPEIRAVVKAVMGCSLEQRRYLWKHVLPKFKPSKE